MTDKYFKPFLGSEVKKKILKHAFGTFPKEACNIWNIICKWKVVLQSSTGKLISS